MPHRRTAGVGGVASGSFERAAAKEFLCSNSTALMFYFAKPIVFIMLVTGNVTITSTFLVNYEHAYSQ